MSNPRQDVRDAQSIKLGLLAAKSASLLAKALAHKELTEADREVLGKAEEFLRAAASGAVLVTTGEYVVGSAIEPAVETLGYALPSLEPDETEADANEDPSKIFVELADVLKALGGDQPDPTPQEMDRVRRFFEMLREYLVGVLERGRQRERAIELGYA